jgi:hypothetical protein
VADYGLAYYYDTQRLSARIICLVTWWFSDW